MSHLLELTPHDRAFLPAPGNLGETGLLEDPHQSGPGEGVGVAFAKGINGIAFDHLGPAAGGEVAGGGQERGGDALAPVARLMKKQVTDQTGRSSSGPTMRELAMRGNSSRGATEIHPVGVSSL